MKIDYWEMLFNGCPVIILATLFLLCDNTSLAILMLLIFIYVRFKTFKSMKGYKETVRSIANYLKQSKSRDESVRSIENYLKQSKSRDECSLLDIDLFFLLILAVVSLLVIDPYLSGLPEADLFYFPCGVAIFGVNVLRLAYSITADIRKHLGDQL